MPSLTDTALPQVMCTSETETSTQKISLWGGPCKQSEEKLDIMKLKNYVYMTWEKIFYWPFGTIPECHYMRSDTLECQNDDVVIELEKKAVKCFTAVNGNGPSENKHGTRLESNYSYSYRNGIFCSGESLNGLQRRTVMNWNSGSPYKKRNKCSTQAGCSLVWANSRFAVATKEMRGLL